MDVEAVFGFCHACRHRVVARRILEVEQDFSGVVECDDVTVSFRFWCERMGEPQDHSSDEWVVGEVVEKIHSRGGESHPDLAVQTTRQVVGEARARFGRAPWVLAFAFFVVAGIGAGARWYRTLFLEEANQDYVRTARAKGASELRILFRHILPNALIPILTGVVVVIPTLFMGSLLIEAFFGIPGLGSYMLDAIRSQDFAIVRSMVFIGSILYIVGLILTDISYTWADPRVRLN